MSDRSAPPNPSIADDGRELRCPGCDYDLRALYGDRCPECGLLLDRKGMSVSQIPWTLRREMGTFRAFRRTCWLIFWRPGRAAEDAARPVSFQDAKRFQRIVILLNYLPLLAIGLWAFFAMGDVNPFRQAGIHGITSATSPPTPDVPHARAFGHWLGWTLEGIGLIFAAICLWLFFKAITGVGSYFFHPRDLSIPRQNRAVALSYYACTPLAWTPVTLILYGVLAAVSSSRWADTVRGWETMALLNVAGFVSAAVQLAAWWRSTLVLLKRTTRCDSARVLTAGIALPFLWLACGVLTLIVLPAAYLLVCAVILSLG